LSACRETLLNGMNQRGMRAQFQPEIHAEFREGIHRPERTARAASPLPSAPGRRIPRCKFSRHRAEERGRFRLRVKISEGLLQRFRAGRMSG